MRFHDDDDDNDLVTVTLTDDRRANNKFSPLSVLLAGTRFLCSGFGRAEKCYARTHVPVIAAADRAKSEGRTRRRREFYFVLFFV